MLSLVRSKDKGGGDWLGLVTRDCPNIIIPSLALAINPLAGINWAWGNWKTVVASLLDAFILKNMIYQPGMGVSVIVDGTNSSYNIGHIQLATYANQAYTPIAECQFADGYIYDVSGLGVDAYANIINNAYRPIRIGSVLVPISSQISVRVTYSGAPNIHTTYLYLTGYYHDALSFIDVPYVDTAYELGQKASYPSIVPLASSLAVTSGTTNWTFGSYVVVSASLDADYLICGCSTTEVAAGSLNAQLDFSIGASGSEFVQARSAHISTGLYKGCGYDYFPYPFIAYSGERLSVRLAGNSLGTARVIRVTVYGIKLA